MQQAECSLAVVCVRECGGRASVVRDGARDVRPRVRVVQHARSETSLAGQHGGRLLELVLVAAEDRESTVNT